MTDQPKKHIRITGLYTKTFGEDKVLSGKVKDTVTIPAGTFLNVRKNGFKAGDRDPDFILSMPNPDAQAAPKPQEGGGDFF